MKIFILIFFFEIKESKITRGHNYTLVKKQSRLDVRKFSFSQRTINVWNNLSEASHRQQNVTNLVKISTNGTSMYVVSKERSVLAVLTLSRATIV